MSNPYHVGHNSGTGATLTSPVSTTTAVGDVLVATVYTAAGVPSVSDTQNNQYILVNSSALAGSPGGNPVVYQFVTTGKNRVLTAGTDTMKVTLPVSGAVNFGVVGVPGAVYAPVDAIGSGLGTSNSPSATSGAFGLAQSEIAIGSIGSAVAATVTWQNGFAQLANVQGSLTMNVSIAWVSASSAVAAAGTFAASQTWAACVVTLIMTSFVGNPPVPPSQFAGSLATSADMNALARTAAFLLRPPMIRVLRAASPQALLANTPTAIGWDTLSRDTDGFWSPVNPSRLTVQTQGIYRVRYSVPYTTPGLNCAVWAQITTGPNNPAGSGIQTQGWYGWTGSGNSIISATPGGGIIPGYLYPLDYVEIIANLLAAGSLQQAITQVEATLKLVSV